MDRDYKDVSEVASTGVGQLTYYRGRGDGKVEGVKMQTAFWLGSPMMPFIATRNVRWGRAEGGKMIVSFKYVNLEAFVRHPHPDDHTAAWVKGSRALECGLCCESILGYYPNLLYGWI